MRRAGQRGQGLVETAIALPVLLLVLLGLLQLGFMIWQRMMLQHAANCAARAYTVWKAEDPAQALKKAERAARQGLRGAPRPRSLRVDLLDDAVVVIYPKVSVHRLALVAEWDPLLRLPPWRDGIFLSVQSGILSEAIHVP